MPRYDYECEQCGRVVEIEHSIKDDAVEREPHPWKPAPGVNFLCNGKLKRLCGKPNCKCTRGHKHRSLYLVLVKAGKTHQLYVPRQLEAKVRQWVRNYHAIRDLMDQVSQIHWDKVRTRQG